MNDLLLIIGGIFYTAFGMFHLLFRLLRALQQMVFFKLQQPVSWIL